MATNKRKEAAALFELIDKSTLKVPKNAGSLKIPAWWSSKTNPEAASGAERAAEVERAEAAPRVVPQVKANGAGAVVNGAGVVKKTGENGNDAGKGSGQHRLFDPPVGQGNGAVAPSIRPPTSSVPVPVNASVKAPPPVPVASERVEAGAGAEVVKGTEPVSEEELATEEVVVRGTGGMSGRAFAPQTHAQGGRSWSPPRAGSLARVPVWVLGAGAVGLILVICLVVWAFRGKPATTGGSGAAVPRGVGGQSAGAGSAQNDQGPPPNTGGRLVENGGRGTSLVPRGNNNDVSVPAPAAGTVGKVYEPGTVPHTGDLLYIMIATTPTKSIAERNARLLAENGVDVSIETVNSKGVLFYKIISVQGFTSVAAADATRARIVEIGHLLPEYKRTKRAWDDAAVVRISDKAAAPGR